MVFKAPEILEPPELGLHKHTPGILHAIHTCFTKMIPQLALCFIYDKTSFSSLATMRNLKARKFRNSKKEPLLSQISPLGLVD